MLSKKTISKTNKILKIKEDARIAIRIFNGEKDLLAYKTVK
jgi:hypothetical protein